MRSGDLTTQRTARPRRRGRIGLRRLTARLAVIGAMAVIAWPSGTMHAALWAANHDMVDVPYVRDCHGIFRHPQECPGAVATPVGR